MMISSHSSSNLFPSRNPPYLEHFKLLRPLESLVLWGSIINSVLITFLRNGLISVVSCFEVSVWSQRPRPEEAKSALISALEPKIPIQKRLRVYTILQILASISVFEMSPEMQRNLLEEIQSLESMTKEGLVAGRCRLEAETNRGKALSISASRILIFSSQLPCFSISDQQSSLSWIKFMLQSKESSRRSGEQESRGVEFPRLTFYLS